MQKQIKIDKKLSEQILVVPKKFLSKHLCHKGISKIDENFLQNIIQQNALFISREKAEIDKEFKQIIPYLVFSFSKSIFLTRRKQSASEQRLAGKFSLGIGGHLRKNDLDGENLFTWAQREFYEEVNFSGTFDQQFLGLINDQTNSVGQVHTGLFWLVKLSNPEISVKSELAYGALATMSECLSIYGQLESWSQLVIGHLSANKKLLFKS